MCNAITKDTIVTIYEVIMDYVYIWGLEVPITDALSEISKKQTEDEHSSTYHICIGTPATNRICSIAMNNVRFDEDNCIPDITAVAALLTPNGSFEFKLLLNESWSLKKSLLLSNQ